MAGDAPLLVTVAESTEQWKQKFGDLNLRTVVTIGNFDGVHLGHQKILQTVNDWVSLKGSRYKKQEQLIPTVLTFYPHPARILRPAAAPLLLTTLPQRLAAFEAAGMQAALVLKFDEHLAAVSAEDFTQKYLVEALSARAVLVGADFRFGNRQSGDVKLLEELGQHSGFEVVVVPPILLDGVVVSSTAVRAAVSEGRMEEAARLLGRPFELAGEIKTGTGMGRKLVVPTLNLATDQECLPKNGVYATESVVGGKTYQSATNVGVRPTFDGQRLAIESHLFDFSDSVTSGPMEVRFCKRLRDEQKFSGPDALREQILRDITQAKAYFAALTKK
jgi:riboflavin kinase/FMN adenylyltransferase